MVQHPGGEQCKLSQVVALIHSDDAYCPHHGLVEDDQDSLGGFFSRDAKWFCDLVSNAARARSARIGMRPLSNASGLRRPSRHVGVGDRRLSCRRAHGDAALGRAPALRGPTCRKPPIVDPCDAAAARADRVNVGNRKASGQPSNFTLARNERSRVFSMRQASGRGAADIEGDQIAVPGAAAEVHRADHARGGPEASVQIGRCCRLHVAKQIPIRLLNMASRQGRDCSSASRVSSR